MNAVKAVLFLSRDTRLDHLGVTTNYESSIQIIFIKPKQKLGLLPDLKLSKNLNFLRTTASEIQRERGETTRFRYRNTFKGAARWSETIVKHDEGGYDLLC